MKYFEYLSIKSCSISIAPHWRCQSGQLMALPSVIWGLRRCTSQLSTWAVPQKHIFTKVLISSPSTLLVLKGKAKKLKVFCIAEIDAPLRVFLTAFGESKDILTTECGWTQEGWAYSHFRGNQLVKRMWRWCYQLRTTAYFGKIIFLTLFEITLTLNARFKLWMHTWFVSTEV